MTVWNATTPRVILSFGLTAALLLVQSGCLWIGSHVKPPWSDDEPPPVLPDRILSVWSDTLLHQPGQPGIRGFGGRVFFYVDGEEDPVQVDGAVIVYAFDAEAADPHNPRPEKKFVFKRENMAEHYSKNNIGHTYNFWLPWDVVGGPTQQIKLVTRFEGARGGTVFSESIVKLLPGAGSSQVEIGDPQPTADRPADASIEQASFTPAAPSDDKPATGRTMQSHSISVPPGVASRLVNASPPAPQTARHAALSASATQANRGMTQNLPNGNQLLGPEAADRPHTAELGAKVSPPAFQRFTPSRLPQRTFPRFAPSRNAPRRQPHQAKWPSNLPLTPRNRAEMTNDETPNDERIPNSE